MINAKTCPAGWNIGSKRGGRDAMVGLTPVVALLAIFIIMGFSIREFDRGSQVWLLMLIIAVVVLNFVGFFGSTGGA